VEKITDKVTLMDPKAPQAMKNRYLKIYKWSIDPSVVV